MTQPYTPKLSPQKTLYFCDYCTKNYSRPSTLKTHMRKHTGVKAFACPLCSKAFSEKGNLKTHLRVHTGEKPFACNLCNKRFTTQGHLTDHSRRHTNTRPFLCECGSSFMRSSTLKSTKEPIRGKSPTNANSVSRSLANLETLGRI